MSTDDDWKDEARTFTTLKLHWFDQVMYDTSLTTGVRLIGLCIVQHYTAETLKCCPGITHIADKLKTTKETVLGAGDQLAARGHLKIDYGRPGRGHSHQYWPILKGRVTGPFSPPEKVCSSDLYNRNALEKRSDRQKEKVGSAGVKGRIDPDKRSAQPTRTLLNTLNTFLNTDRSAIDPADKQRYIELFRSAIDPADKSDRKRYSELCDALEAMITLALAVGGITKDEARKRRTEITRLDKKIVAGHADYAHGLERLMAIGNAVRPKQEEFLH